ncbi:MAG: NAD-dependent malic enzyme [Deltaproteobacteria bacterium]|jgi:malate dehydrogenase (oxaloacetate-decarboxylating)|nr:NAD-dependent malic enzyme [Deltaproteobacteria bacterium]
MVAQTVKKPDRNPDEDRDYFSRALDSCRALAADPGQAHRLTDKYNSVAVLTDGSSVPGLGDVGPLASLPLVEGKARLMGRLADIAAFPLVVDARTADDVVRTVSALAHSFGAVSLEAMSEATSLEIKRRIQDLGELPVFHDTQDGLPVLCLAAVLNALKVVGKKMAEIRLVIAGTEAEGLPVVDFFRLAGAADIVVCDRTGAIHRGRPGVTNWIKEELALKTNPRQVKGSLTKSLAGADVLILVSQAGPPGREVVAPMAEGAVVLNLTDQKGADFEQAAVLADTGRERPGRLTGSLVFPGLIRGALDSRARSINAPMKMAAAMALSRLVPEAELSPELIVPGLDKSDLVSAMAEAVSAAAAASGTSRLV